MDIAADTAMTSNVADNKPNLLLLVAGAKGAIGSTIAATLCAWQKGEHNGRTGLTTADKFAFLGDLGQMQMKGWDTDERPMEAAIKHHGVLPRQLWEPYHSELSGLEIRPAPSMDQPLGLQVEAVRQDIQDFKRQYPVSRPVYISLLPACWDISQSHRLTTIENLLEQSLQAPPDLAFAIAAIEEGVPVVNFTPNTIEIDAVCNAARTAGVPLAGRDGKTGQTYFKVVLASAFKARGLNVDGWYSLNILGNADGENLMDPDRACGKLQNKTQLLDDILGYPVGQQYGQSSHMVRIDYYPPRGDAKEAWDVIDFSGLLGLPMSMRINLQGRDSILAAPMAIDLARWAAALQHAGYGGPIAELGFFFKKPVGSNPPLTFQDQLAGLQRLEAQIYKKIGPAE